ncbi:FxDxF family PEP-CTERM protein [Sphingomonas sp. Ag1]|jgi:hypothetical protein|uniref:FxDxF family PEP-CTERM protein n=1 Tax=Sphingomonas sp. Ag1 TaxID=1642949 RepID=UPI0006228B4B|nr:FxDxF family PEP-CTERM protein [Sphingomonas sp. Ag1]KKI20376.1 hypothetical protein XM50_05815 [Sphingomonas sp. Ag1]
MRKSLMALYGAAALVAFTPAAHAVDFEPGDTGFEVSGDINSGPVTANVGRSGIGLGDFTDNFFFIIDQNGLGSGSISTSATIFRDVTDLDLTSVSFNGVEAAITRTAQGLFEVAFAKGINIVSGQENTLTVSGNSRGAGSYGGQLTFTPVAAIPELGTWGMMILGFAFAGSALRVRRRSAKVAFA